MQLKKKPGQAPAINQAAPTARNGNCKNKKTSGKKYIYIERFFQT